MIISNDYAHERETKNTVRYSRTDESGRKDVLYVPKAELAGERPNTITVTLDWS
jgi:hypothetical protein